MLKRLLALVALSAATTLLSAQSGNLDNTFSPNLDGKVRFNPSNTLDVCTSVMTQADGKVLMAGYFNNGGLSRNFGLLRLLSDGKTLDKSFGPEGTGIVRTDVDGEESAAYLAIDASGRIILAGYSIIYDEGTATVNHFQIAVARYLPNGSLDGSFGQGGLLSQWVRVPFFNFVGSVATLADGSVLVGGVVYDLPKGDYRPFVMKYDNKGVPDAKFGTSGLVVLADISTALNGGPNVAGRLAVQPDGKIVIASSKGTLTVNELTISRLNPDGMVDKTFDTDGEVLLNIGANADIPNQVAIAANGSIFITGATTVNSASTPDAFVAKLQPTGAVDATFGTNGVKILSINPSGRDEAFNINLLNDGRLLVGGGVNDPTPRGFIAVLKSDGNFDTTFGSNGFSKTTYTEPTFTRLATRLADGQFLLGGHAGLIPTSAGGDFAFSLFTQTGQLRTDIGGGAGIQLLPLGAGIAEFSAVKLQSDGKIVAAGTAYWGTDEDFMVARFLPNGAIDPNFGQNGSVLANFLTFNNDYDGASDIEILPDGKILVAGTLDSMRRDTLFALMRLLPNGSFDPSFGVGGKSMINWSKRADEIYDIALQNDGKIVAVGRTGTGKLAVARLKSTGVPDSTFGTAGMTTLNVPNGSLNLLRSVAIDANGKIVVAGEVSKTIDRTTMIFARLLPNGQPDATFSGDGILNYTGIVANSDGSSNVAILADGKILVLGYRVDQGTGKGTAVLLRINPDGQYDNTYGEKAFDFGMPVLGGNPFDMVLQSDEKPIIAGYAIMGAFPDISLRMALARRLSNGNPDPDFGSNGNALIDFGLLASPFALAAALQPNEKLVAAGVVFDGPVDQDAVLVRVIASLKVGVLDRPQSISEAWVYPNPMRTGESFAFTYELKDDAPVLMELLDLQGKTIATLLDAARGAGEQKESLLLPQGLANGFYLLRVIAPNGSAVVKVLIEK